MPKERAKRPGSSRFWPFFISFNGWGGTNKSIKK